MLTTSPRTKWVFLGLVAAAVGLWAVMEQIATTAPVAPLW